jgi:hypothetical protein
MISHDEKCMVGAYFPLFVIYCTFTHLCIPRCISRDPRRLMFLSLPQQVPYMRSLVISTIQGGCHALSKGLSSHSTGKSSSFPAQIFRHDTKQGLEQRFRLRYHFTSAMITACGSSSCLVRSKSEIWPDLVMSICLSSSPDALRRLNSRGWLSMPEPRDYHC